MEANINSDSLASDTINFVQSSSCLLQHHHHFVTKVICVWFSLSAVLSNIMCCCSFLSYGTVLLLKGSNSKI